MYSGSTMKQTRHFDAWFGAHQKIDRTARRHLEHIVPGANFPTLRQVLKFEGMDGPDGIKRKTPTQDEPKHFFDPESSDDTDLPEIIQEHYDLLVKALKGSNTTRASFEAAWLAHAVVDGLTPAHHYPYEKELVRLRSNGIDMPTNPKEKLIMSGDTFSQRVSNNWEMWGDKGLLTTHIAFEIGIAVMIMPLRFKQAAPTEQEIRAAQKAGVLGMFRTRAREINELQMYEQFYKSGWTPKLSKVVRQQLLPIIINTVTLTWYLAVQEAAV